MYYWKNKNRQVFSTSLVIVSTLLLLSGCERQQRVKAFYPIDSLVSGQIQILANEKAALKKEARIGKQHGRTEFVPKDTTAWVDELDIFRQLKAINKPVNHPRYIVDDGLFDPGSNLTVKAFSSIDDPGKEELPVKWLRIYYDESVKKPRKIEAEYQENNAYYRSSRIMLLEFQQVNNKTILTSYSIEGGQKMIFSDSVEFSIKGRILIN